MQAPSLRTQALISIVAEAMELWMLPEEDMETEPGPTKAAGVLQLCLRRSWLFGNLELTKGGPSSTAVSCLCREEIRHRK